MRSLAGTVNSELRESRKTGIMLFESKRKANFHDPRNIFYLYKLITL